MDTTHNRTQGSVQNRSFTEVRIDSDHEKKQICLGSQGTEAARMLEEFQIHLKSFQQHWMRHPTEESLEIEDLLRCYQFIGHEGRNSLEEIKAAILEDNNGSHSVCEDSKQQELTECDGRRMPRIETLRKSKVWDIMEIATKQHTLSAAPTFDQYRPISNYVPERFNNCPVEGLDMKTLEKFRNLLPEPNMHLIVSCQLQNPLLVKSTTVMQTEDIQSVDATQTDDNIRFSSSLCKNQTVENLKSECNCRRDKSLRLLCRG